MISKQDVQRILEEERARNLRPGRQWGEAQDKLMKRREQLRDAALRDQLAFKTLALDSSSKLSDKERAEMLERCDLAGKRAALLTEQLSERAPDEAELERHAVMGLRTRLFAMLQEESPPPSEPREDEDLEDLSARQHSHNKKLWKRVDALLSGGVS